MNTGWFTLLDTISVILATSAAVFGWWFVTVYSRENWRSLPAGRHLMRFTSGVALICTWSVVTIILRILFPNDLWLILFIYTGRITIFGWVTLMLYSRLRLLQKEIARGAHQQEEVPDHGRTV